MSECYFSFKMKGIYIQLTKQWEFQIVAKDNEGQWRTKVLLALQL